MRKKDSRPVFVSKWHQREARVAALRALNTPESRAELKKMNTVVVGATVPTNIKGVYGKTRPVRGRVNAKNRGCLRASKAIMMLKG